MIRNLALIAFVAFVALLPATASADDPDDSGFVLRIHGTYSLPPDARVGSAVVVKGDALIAGTVRHRLVVIDGNADIAGHVDGDVTVIRGTVTLEGGSHVDGVTIIRGTVNRQNGSVVEHGINHRSVGIFRGAFLLFWLGLTLTVLVGGLVFAAIGGRQLAQASAGLTERLAYSILGAVVVWIGFPVLAVLALITVVGIPFGLAVALVVLPLLWFLGYLVAGTRLGAALLALGGSPKPVDHPYVAAALGLIILQIVILVPVVGWAIAAIAGVWGSGALGATAFGAWRRRDEGAREGPA